MPFLHDLAIWEVLATEGSLVVAWEAWTTRGDKTLLVYSVQSRPTQLIETDVPASNQDAMSKDLRQRGVRVGEFVPRSQYFWCADDKGFALWSLARLEAEGTHGDLVLAAGRRVTNSQVRAVVSFVSDDMVHRGVRLDLDNGSRVVVAQDEDLAPIADPGYDVANLAIDASWARHLGIALANWLNRPHIDQVP